MSDSSRYVVLSGGVGGAKLVLGLAHVVDPDALTIIVNTGDDFEHLGLNISPDIDTLMYTLAGEVDEQTGWGRKEESWNFMESLERLGGETWFRLGDRDLATHVQRSQRLASGATLTEVTAQLTRQFGVTQFIVPMSDQPVRTRVVTADGPLAFQHYFVRDHAAPPVAAIEFHGAASARPVDAALTALRDPRLAGVIIAPSNPYLSIDPILAVPSLRSAIAAAKAPVVAISPIVGDAAIKGPTAKIMRELGHDVSARSIAEHYGDLLDRFIIDETDHAAAADIANPALEVTASQTIMRSLDDRIELAKVVLGVLASSD